MSDLATRARRIGGDREQRAVLYECAAELERKDAEIARLTAGAEESLTTHLGTTAEDWAGMWTIANERANKAEADLAAARLLAGSEGW